jgi:hypothetical protein
MKSCLVVLSVLTSCWNLAWGADTAKSWRLATDDTVVVVTVQDGTPVVTQVGTVKDNSNWLLTPESEVLLPTVTQKDSSVPTTW